MKESKINNIPRVLEVFWLVLAMLTLLISLYFILQGDRSQALYFLVMGFVSGLMHLMRKKQRKIHMKGLEKDKEIKEQEIGNKK